MSLIEKAVQRLDQLKQAGVYVPEAESPAAPVVAAPAVTPEALPVAPAPEPVVPAAAVAPSPVAAAPDADQTPLALEAVSAPAQQPAAAPAGNRPDRITIDLERLTTVGFIAPDKPNSPMAEQYRIIKRPLLRNAQGRGAAPVVNGNLVMVTSSVPGEGKSFSAVNLALSIAMELDHTVLLVDADVSKPSVLSSLGLPPAKGLMDVLLGNVGSIGDVLLRTNIEKLTILPAGMPHQRATEFLASETMNTLLAELATRYSDRIVIFDSPPLLVTTEARTLATHMGQIVMVVEATRTTHAMVQQALATIDACPVKLMLLNKVRGNSGAGHYGVYGYGYGYGRSEASQVRACPHARVGVAAARWCAARRRRTRGSPLAADAGTQAGPVMDGQRRHRESEQALRHDPQVCPWSFAERPLRRVLRHAAYGLGRGSPF